jgi:hypothetical protein
MMPTKSMWTDSFTEFVNCKNNIGIARKLARLEVNRYGGKLIHGVAATKSRKKEKQSKCGCLVLFSTIFNISDLLVDKYVNSYQKSSEGWGFLKDKIKTEE